jgi:hypothetical protein
MRIFRIIGLAGYHIRRLYLGKNDFDAIDAFRIDRYLLYALGLERTPSAAILRQRMDAHAEAFSEHRSRRLDPADLPAWLAERSDPGRVPARPPAVASANARLWAACCALPGLPITTAQAQSLHRHLGLPRDWRPPAEAPGAARTGTAGPRFTPAEGRALLGELADQEGSPSTIEATAPGAARQRLERALAFW